MKKGNNDRLAARRRQKSAARSKARKRMAREIEREYLAMRRAARQPMSLPDVAPGEGEDEEPKEKPKEEADKLSLDSVFSFPVCEGVGECCKDRFLLIEPTDIWRILRNEKVRERWGVKYTMDLFGLGKPLVYDIDNKNGMPGSAAVRREVEGKGYQVCPFLDIEQPIVLDAKEKWTCMLGEDRPTFCKCDPVVRYMREDGRRHAGWSYTVNDSLCVACMRCDPRKDNRVTVESFLVDRGMEERYMFADLFMGYMEWVRKNTMSLFQRKLAAMLVFDWHNFLINFNAPKDGAEVPWDEPKDPREIFVMAKVVLSKMIEAEREQISGKGDE